VRLAHLLRSKMGWLGASSPTVLSSRVRLARNLRGRPFPHRARPAELRAVLDEALRAAATLPPLAGAARLRLDDVDGLDRSLLVERHLASPLLARSGPERGIVIQAGERLSVMVNEEDHLRLQAMAPGAGLREAWQGALGVDLGLEGSLPYAFHERWGFLSACPSNVGTGLRASCLAHLPALMMTGAVQEALEALQRAGMAVRGLFGEGTNAAGDLFQVSNARSLGPAEEELVEGVAKAVERLSRREEAQRRALVLKDRVALEDSVGRAWGILTNARRVSFDEAAALLSKARLGAALGLLKVPLERLDPLFVVLGPAHLQVAEGRELAPAERDELRAKLLRERLSGAAGGA